ncbi:hypothetical protein [Plantactinospora soyae]|uniref:Uncharacterized protein n=1 Tax=Plantactinospora soyae TaxID=1544732 RepID=A0A927M984_9ACTN|nr:hypothetical protein [Plantactinospora soyae]MBE1489275.1 hypothetical protein [Plantactinospora soyae]
MPRRYSSSRMRSSAEWSRLLSPAPYVAIGTDHTSARVFMSDVAVFHGRVES